MKGLALLVLLAALSACEQVGTKTAEYEPTDAGTVDHAMCLLGFTAVPLRELVTGHHLVEVALNGRKATFVLDTGANRSVLHTPYSAEFGLTEGVAVPGAAVGIGGAMRAKLVSFERLEIGTVTIRESRIMTADLSQLTKLLGPLAGRKIYGLIGQDVMKEHRAVIDVSKPILYLMKADKDPAPVPAERCRESAEGSGSAKKKAAQL